MTVNVSAGISVVKIVSGGPIKIAVATVSLYVIHKLLKIGEEELPKFLIKQGYSADKVAKYSKAICGLLNKLCKLFVVIGGLKNVYDIASEARGFTNNTMQAAKQSLKDFAKNFKYEKHHVFNKFRGNSQYSNYFKILGIDVDKYCIRLTKAKHETLYWCTAKWKFFIDSHPIPANLTEAQKTILRDCVFKFAKTMVRENGLSWKDVIPYK